MKDMAKYFDSLDLIGHKRPDGPSFDVGDSCREFGTYAAGIEMRKTLCGWDLADHLRWTRSDFIALRNMAQQYRITRGVYVRHPDPVPGDAWQKDPKEFSRDQWTGLMCGLIMMDTIETHNLIAELYDVQKPFTFQNGDLMTFEWSFYIRGARSSRFYLLLPILDLGLVVNSLFRVISALIQPHETAPDINHTTSLAVAYFVMPTPISWLARQLYRLRRGGIITAWREYHNPSKFPAEAPPLDELWEPIIEVLF